MNFTHSVFKAYDIRGLVGTELTLELAEAVGRAFADFLPEPGPVVVGYDMRPDSKELAARVQAGLVRQGRDVILIGEVASDVIYFATGYLKAAGGAMVTASHNPGAYNGIKLCREEARGVSLETGLGEIRDAIVADQYRAVGVRGKTTEQDVMPVWTEHALGFVKVDSWRPYHIAVDAGNGMGGAVMPHLVGKWPLKVEPLFWELDGTFPNHPANPLIEENNRFLVAKIREQGLDFGVAFDGDGDRAFLVDELGRTVPGYVMCAMLAEYFLQHNPGAAIVYDVRTSRVVADTIREHGGKPVRSRVGHSYIKQVMREHEAPFGGELSGHFYFRDNYYADSGLIAALVAIEVLNASGKKLSELADAYEGRYARSGETNFEVADKDGKLAELKAAFADGEIDELDGVTVNYPEWWFNARPSNTEPYLRLNVEAVTSELLSQKLSELQRLLGVRKD